MIMMVVEMASDLEQARSPIATKSNSVILVLDVDDKQLIAMVG